MASPSVPLGFLPGVHPTLSPVAPPPPFSCSKRLLRAASGPDELCPLALQPVGSARPALPPQLSRQAAALQRRPL